MAQSRPDSEIPVATWQTIAEVLLRMQLELDRNWSLEDAAKVAGYQEHHFAHCFSAVVGEAPASYVRRLRLERAAAALASESASVLEVAVQSGYASAEAFGRAFRRAFKVSPTEFREGFANTEKPVALAADPPYAPGLSRSPVIDALSPMWAWTLPSEKFDAEHFGGAMMELLSIAPPDGPWQIGGLAQPWGWLRGGFRQDLRAVRYFDGPRPGATPPILPWRLVPSWYATFEFDGPPDAIPAAFEWIMRTWIPRAGLRPAFLPTLSQLESFELERVRARLHAPIRRLNDGGPFGE